MHVFDDLPILDKSALFELLSKRFDNEEKKLSQIPNPQMLHDAPKAAKKIADAIREGKKITLVGDYDGLRISRNSIINIQNIIYNNLKKVLLNKILPNKLIIELIKAFKNVFSGFIK